MSSERTSRAKTRIYSQPASYFADAARKSRLKKRLEVDRLEEKNERLQNEVLALQHKAKHAHSVLDFWTEYQMKTDNSEEQLKFENLFLRNEVKRQRSHIKNVQKVFSEMFTETHQIDRILFANDRMKEVFTTIMSLCYSSSNSSSWKWLNRKLIKPLESGPLKGASFSFRYLPSKDIILNRMDLVDFPLSYEQTIQLFEAIDDGEINGRFLKHLIAMAEYCPKFEAQIDYMLGSSDSHITIQRYRLPLDGPKLFFSGVYNETVNGASLFGDTAENNVEVNVRTTSLYSYNTDFDLGLISPFGELRDPYHTAVLIRRGENGKTNLTFLKHGNDIDSLSKVFMNKLGFHTFSQEGHGLARMESTKMLLENMIPFLQRQDYFKTPQLNPFAPS